ncbi:MAG: hypothetical protein CW694_06275 [Candidatus Syntrophoarchaeum sp. WYZ-LMO15]|nr:MAG: hypothetical protein CW694_06275 [Candidatus Syntrophoarchaeum sp. WYZ-LMO15]
MIVRGAWVLPVTHNPIRAGGVLIRDGVIKAVGSGRDLERAYPDEEVLFFENEVIMPGFVNLHSHIEYSSLHKRCRRGSFTGWIQDMIRESRRMEDDDWVRSSGLGAREMVRSGVTCIGDITKTDTSFDAILDAGIRGVVFLEVIGFDDSVVEDIITGLIERIRRFRSRGNGRVRIGVSPHAPYTVSRRLFEAVGSVSSRMNLPVMTHLAETEDEERFVRDGEGIFAGSFKDIAGWKGVEWRGVGLSPASYLDACGLLSERTVVAHAVHVSDEDILLLKRRGVSIAHCPRSNRYLGVGDAPVKKILDMGINLGLGTDSLASVDSIDIFQEMRSIDPRVPPPTRIRMATINGAKALGMEDQTGSLEPGKCADIIAVTTEKDDPYSVYLSSRDDIRIVIAGGSVLYED